MSRLHPAIERALQLQQEQDPPFSEEALTSVERLGVLSLDDATDLARLTSLRTLILIGFGGQDLSPLAKLPLAWLDISVSAVRDLVVVAELPGLRALKVRNNAIVALDVLAAGGHRLVELDLTGNPLSDHAYTEVVPILRERVPGLRVSDELEWRLTRQLYEAGVPFDYYRDERGYWLCRPGLEYTRTPDGGHLKINPDELEAVLDRDPFEVPRLFPASNAS